MFFKEVFLLLLLQSGSTGRAVLDGVGAARAQRGRGRAGRGPAQHAVRAGAGQPPRHGAPPAGLRRRRALQRRRGQSTLLQTRITGYAILG